MTRVSPNLLALAGFAALLAAPAIRAGAQGTPPSTNASVSGEGVSCSDPKTGPLFTSTPSSSCARAGTVTDPVAGPFTVSASATATPGVSVQAESHFDGTAGSIPGESHASAVYYQYVTFSGPGASSVASIVFTSTITASLSADDPAANPSYAGFLEFGKLDTDNSFLPQFNSVSFTQDDDCGFPSCTLSGTVDVASDLGGAHSFYYDIFGQTDITVAFADPMSDSFFVMLDPHIEFLDSSGHPVDGVIVSKDPPVVASPEPASLALLGTGFVGLVGFARRKRSA